MHGDGWNYLFMGLLAWYLTRRIRRAGRPTPVEIRRDGDL
jgi:hypothetical protein